MEDRNIEFLAQSLFDLKATRCGNVFEIDPTESRRDRFHCAHDLVRIFRIQTDRKRIHAGELFEQHRLAFHHRQCCCWPNVAESEHCSSVSHDRDRVFLDRQGEEFVRILLDGFTDTSHARRVGH